MQRGNQARNKKGGARKAPQGTKHPPAFSPTAVIKRRLRFKATAASTADGLLGTSFGDCFCVASSAVAAAQLGNFMRIRSIEIWAPMAADLIPVTCSVEWESTTLGVYGKSVRHSDTSMGSAEPAHVMSRPPKDSQVAQWLRTNTTAPIATLAYPANSIVEVVYDLVLRDDGSSNPVTGAVAGATAGTVYVRALNSPVNSNLVPLSVATI